MRVELLPEFLKRKEKPELPFDQQYEEFDPKGVVVSGYVPSYSPFTPFIDGDLGSLRDGTTRKTRFLVDSGAHVTVLMPRDAKLLLKRVKREPPRDRSHIVGVKSSMRIEGTFLDTEVWFSGKYFSEDVLLAIRLRAFLILEKEDSRDRGFASLLGRDVLGQSQKLEIVLANGRVVFKAKNSDNVRAYRKIS